MDKETLAVLREGQMLDDYTKSEGWAWIKDRLTEKIMDLQSIRNLEGTDPMMVVQDIKARNTAIEILEEIIKDVEGRAEQHSSNNQKTYVQEEIIIYEN